MLWKLISDKKGEVMHGKDRNNCVKSKLWNAQYYEIVTTLQQVKNQELLSLKLLVKISPKKNFKVPSQ